MKRETNTVDVLLAPFPSQNMVGRTLKSTRIVFAPYLNPNNAFYAKNQKILVLCAARNEHKHIYTSYTHTHIYTEDIKQPQKYLQPVFTYHIIQYVNCFFHCLCGWTYEHWPALTLMYSLQSTPYKFDFTYNRHTKHETHSGCWKPFSYISFSFFLCRSQLWGELRCRKFGEIINCSRCRSQRGDTKKAYV